MLLEAGRDTAAMFFLDVQLGIVRETHLERILAGEPVEEDFWERAEDAVVREVKERFYAPRVQESVKARKDYGDHSQKLVEKGIWIAHRRLRDLPFVGDPRFLEG